MERPIHILTPGQWTSSGGSLTLAAEPNTSWVIPGIILNTNVEDHQSATISFKDSVTSAEFFRIGVGPIAPVTFPRPIKFPKGVGVLINMEENTGGDNPPQFFVTGPYQD